MRLFHLPICRFSSFFASVSGIVSGIAPLRAMGLAAGLILALAPHTARALGPHGDLSAGYSHLWSAHEGDNGWQIDGHLKVAPFLGAEASVAEYSANSGSAYLYLFGPRVTVGVRRVHLFAHFLAGANHATGTHDFVYAAGGGLDYALLPHIGWRFEGDDLHEPSAPATAGRFTTGPVLRF